MFETLRRDAARYRGYGGWYRSLGFWVGATYRLGAWARTLPGLLRVPALLAYGIVKLPWRFLLNVELPASTRIGPGLLLAHPYNVIIGAGAELGDDCQVFHEVTIGRGPAPGLPRLGNAVVLFVGARVLGGIAVGDGTEIGANCVVTRDVPAGAIVVLPTNRVIPQSLVRARPAEEGGTADAASRGGAGGARGA